MYFSIFLNREAYFCQLEFHNFSSRQAFLTKQNALRPEKKLKEEIRFATIKACDVNVFTWLRLISEGDI